MFKFLSISCLFALVSCDPCQWSAQQLSTFKSCIGSSVDTIEECFGKSRNERDWSRIQKEVCRSNESKEKAMKCMQKSKSSSNFQTCWSKTEATTNGSPVGGHSPVSSSTVGSLYVTPYSTYGQTQQYGTGTQGTTLSYDQSSYGSSNGGYGNSGYGSSGNGNSGYGSSGYGNSGYGNSGYGNSGYSGTPSYGNPGYGTNNQNGYGQGYGQSGYGQSGSSGSGMFGGISRRRNSPGTYYG